MRAGHNQRSCWASVFKPVQRNGNMKRLKMSQSVEIVKSHHDKSDLKKQRTKQDQLSLAMRWPMLRRPPEHLQQSLRSPVGRWWGLPSCEISVEIVITSGILYFIAQYTLRCKS